jgi:hypothetical protein
MTFEDVVTTAVYELLEHGFALTVDAGGQDWVLSHCRDAETVLKHMLHAKDERLIVMSGDRMLGWIHFMYDGKPSEVIVSHTGALTEYIPETLGLVDTFRELGR